MISESKQTALMEALAGLTRFPAGNATVASLAADSVAEMYSTDAEVDLIIRKLYGKDGLDEWPGPKSWREWVQMAVYEFGMTQPTASSGWVPHPRNGVEYDRTYMMGSQAYQYWQDGRFHPAGVPVRVARPVEPEGGTLADFMAGAEFQAALKSKTMPGSKGVSNAELD